MSKKSEVLDLVPTEQTKQEKKVLTENKVEKTVNIEYSHTKEIAKQAKDYSKSFNGLRQLFLSGKQDKEISLLSFELKILQNSKKDNALYAHLKEICKYKGSYKNKDGKLVPYEVYNQTGIARGLRKLANDTDKLAELKLKF